jgi:hypothetical protein
MLPAVKNWVTESHEMIECLGRHSWWQHRPKKLREMVPPRAEAHAEREGKDTVYQQHVLRAAADVAEEINNAIYFRRQEKKRSVSRKQSA